VLAIDCATMLLDSVVAAVPGGSCQLLSQLAAEATFPANVAALQILHSRLDNDVELSDSILSALVSCLLKVPTTAISIYVHLHTSGKSLRGG